MDKLEEGIFNRLPRDARLMVLGEVYSALKWRGWDKSRNAASHASDAVLEISKIFEKNGMKLGQYT